MKKITAVTADIDPGDLGFCQSHEHCYIAGSIDDPEKTLAELKLYRFAGGRVLVDAQPGGCGRNAAVLSRISKESGVHIIASTGFHKLSLYPGSHWINTISEEELTRLFIDELDQGMYLDGDSAFPRQQGGAKAGQVKTALDAEGLTSRYQKLFTAAAQAAKAAGCAVMVHIEKDSNPKELAAFFSKQGLPADRLIFCHLDRAIADINIHKEICGQGIYLEYDTIARPKYHDDEKEISIILEMVKSGYEKQLLLSLDTTRSRLRSYGGEPGLAHILEEFIPLLLKHGLTEEHIRSFFIENPARVFARFIAP